MCRSEEHALMVSLAHHPDSASWTLWSTHFDEAGQGALFTDVEHFADDADGRDRLVTAVCRLGAEWVSGFSVKVAGGVPNH